MASPHKQPIALAQLKGADKKNPKRYKDAKAAPTAKVGVGEPDRMMSPAAQAVWRDITPKMVHGVLTVVDGPAWRALCELIAEFNEDPREFSGTKLGKMITLFSLFGMTPVDRAKIRIEQEDKKLDNPFESFAA